MLKNQDIKQIEKKGKTKDDIKNQIELFHKGFPPIELAKPATPNDGIFVLSEKQIIEYNNLYEKLSADYSIMKFVPASGAATRMFKNVYEWKEKLSRGYDANMLLSNDNNAKQFFSRIKDFAFWYDLSNKMTKNGIDAENCLKKKDYLSIIEYLLEDKGIGYGNLPKGLLKFHQYKESNRTSFEEHLVEGALYAKNKNGIVNIHFTVSPEHKELFLNHYKEIAYKYEKYFDVKYQIDFSVQDPSTDTIAVDMDNNPFRESDGKLYFRPGGHGALIKNLNNIDSDIVFIKNIDNVVTDRLKEPTVIYKKMIGGMLLKIREEVFKYKDFIDKNELNEGLYYSALNFACESLNVDKKYFEEVTKEKGTELLRDFFNSPIRVCGMVKNEGEPGGGPFWVKSKNKKISLQIIESSQIDKNNNKQTEIFNDSTHFNPVDIVCSLKNNKGEKYELDKYIDHKTGFISHKSKDGRSLKAMELPGLWNGAMANWITVFVEVPVITFNPVKTVNDLLREEHQ